MNQKIYNVHVFSNFPIFLSEWRQEELERINGTSDGAERKAALCMLLDQETQLISAIGRHKLEADTENKDKRIQAFLNKVRFFRQKIPPKKFHSSNKCTTCINMRKICS